MVACLAMSVGLSFLGPAAAARNGSPAHAAELRRPADRPSHARCVMTAATASQRIPGSLGINFNLEISTTRLLPVHLKTLRSTQQAGRFSQGRARRDVPQAPSQTNVFVSGVGGYHTYRIPAIVLSNDHTLLAFCEGRKGGGGDAGNIDMLVCRSTDQGRTWSRPARIWDDGDNTCGNPCPVVDRTTGSIWLLMT